MKKDKKYKILMLERFYKTASSILYDELGISFDGETKIDEQTSIETHKRVKFNSAQEAGETYVKVMEMKELENSLDKDVTKVRKVLKLAFTTLFDDSKWKLVSSTIFAVASTVNIFKGNFLGTLISLALMSLTMSPIKFLQELKKFLAIPEQIETLRSQLAGKNVLGWADSVGAKGDIKLYIKVKEPSYF